MKAAIFSATTLEELDAKIQDVRSNELIPTLAVVFSSIIHDPAALGRIFSQYDIALFGASTAGEIIEHEVLESTIVGVLFDINPGVFRVASFVGRARDSFEIGNEVGEWAKTSYENPALMVVSAGLFTNGEQMMNGIIKAVGREIPLFGGLAGTAMGMPDTFVFDEQSVLSEGALALAFDSDLIGLRGIASSGWKGIGTVKTVTKSTGNVIFEIDGEPARDLYAKYLDCGDDPAMALSLIAEYPLQLIRDDGTPVLRGVMTLPEDKSLVYAGTIPEGSKVRFSMAPGIEVIDHAIEQISEFAQAVPSPIAVILFSCAARQLALGPMIEDESSRIRDLWKAPMVGFFTYGEIGPSTAGICEFHNHTVVPVAIYEK